MRTVRVSAYAIPLSRARAEQSREGRPTTTRACKTARVQHKRARRANRHRQMRLRASNDPRGFAKVELRRPTSGNRIQNLECRFTGEDASIQSWAMSSCHVIAHANDSNPPRHRFARFLFVGDAPIFVLNAFERRNSCRQRPLTRSLRKGRLAIGGTVVTVIHAALRDRRSSRPFSPVCGLTPHAARRRTKIPGDFRPGGKRPDRCGRATVVCR